MECALAARRRGGDEFVGRAIATDECARDGETRRVEERPQRVEALLAAAGTAALTCSLYL